MRLPGLQPGLNIGGMTILILLYFVNLLHLPYKFKIGSFIYGGDDFWNQYFDEGTSDLNASPFMGDTELNYNFIDDLKFRKGIDIEIDFLGYNFFQNLDCKIR